MNERGARRVHQSIVSEYLLEVTNLSLQKGGAGKHGNLQGPG